jgi:Na+/H+ antiporter NhaD/arsenite permease-like protein
MIGGTIAMTVYKGRVDIGFLAAIVAASNGGGSGSVVGDTTTTMMWLAGVEPFQVLHAYAAAVPALVVFGVICSIKQQRYQAIQKEEVGHHTVDWRRIAAVALILAGAIVANFAIGFPAVGVWVAILAAALFTQTPWREVTHSIKGSVFLLSLVACASMMPVDDLPGATWVTAFFLGAISAVFDNIPLTKLALQQDGYDWGLLAYAVGFGGSMVWFGSSAGVALTNQFPHGRSVAAWIKHGWSVALAYVIGFFILMGTIGWHAETIGPPDELVPEQVQSAPEEPELRSDGS